MKTIFNKIGSGLWLLAVSIFALLSATGCIEEDMPFIVLDNDVVTVETGTSKTSVDVKSNVKWAATSDQAWCQIYSTEGNYKGKFDFVVDPNPNTEERTAIITVAATDGSVQATLMVKQAPIGAKLYISEDKITFNRNKGTRNIAVVSNHNWSVISSSDWCTVSPDSGKEKGNIAIKVTANDTGKERTACVTVVCEVDGDPFIKTVDVVQAATDFFFVVPVMEYNLSNLAKTLEIAYDVEGDNIDINYETNVDWITFGDFVESAEKVVANVAANTTGKARSAKVVLTASNNGAEPIVRIVEIKQSATDFFFVVPVKEFELTNVGKTIEIPYETEGDNVEVTCETNADWISFKEIVQGSGVVEAVIADNTTGKPRTGKIVLAASNNGQEPILQTVTVSQSAKDFYFVVPVQKFELTNAKETVAIKYDVAGDDVKIKHETNVKWISFKEMVEGAGQVEIVVAENKTGADRSAKVVLTASNNAGEPIVHTVEILQSGKDFYFTVPVKEFDVTNAGGVVAVDYKAEGDDVKIEYRSNAEWLSFKDFVEGADQIEVVVAENATGKEREGQVVISASNNGGEPIEYTVNIRQSAKDFYFVVPVKKYELSNAEKALAFKYEVEGDDVKIKYEANVEWISFKNFVEGAGQIEAVVAENKTGEERCAKVVLTASNNGGEPIVETVEIFQSSKDFYFVVPVKKFEFSYDENALAIPYEVEGDDVKIKYETNVDWITFKDFVEGAGQVEAVVAANETGKARSAKVVLTASNNGGEPIVHTVEVFQGAKDFFFVIPVEHYNISFESQEFPINYKVNGDDVEIEYEANVDWIEFGEFVADSCQVNVEVWKNKTGKERTGKVTVTASNNGGEPIVRTVTITQAASGFYFVVPIEEYNLNNEKHDLTIDFQVEGESLKIVPTTNVDWIHFGELSYYERTLEVRVDANKTGKPRTAKILLTASSNKGEPIVRTIIINQSHKEFFFVVPIKKYDVSELGIEELPIIYTAEGDKVEVNAQSNASWVYVWEEIHDIDIPNNHEGLLAGNGIVLVDVLPNATGHERRAQITLTATNNNGEPVVEVVEVVQGKQNVHFELTTDKKTFGPEGGELALGTVLQLSDIEITKPEGPFFGDAVTVLLSCETGADWVTVNGETQFDEVLDEVIYIEGLGIDVAPNETGKERSTEVTFTVFIPGQEAIVRKLQVVQESDRFYFDLMDTEFILPCRVNANHDNENLDFHIGYFASANAQIKCTTNTGWLSVGEPESDFIPATCLQNDSDKPRYGEITVRAEAPGFDPIVKKVKVYQGATENVLEVYVDEVELNGFSGQKAISNILTNNVLNIKQNCDWFSYERKGEQIEITTLSDNITGQDRIGTLTIEGVGHVKNTSHHDSETDPWEEIVTYKNIKVIQHSLETKFEFGKENYVFGFNEGTNYVTLLSTGPWYVDDSVILPKWIKIDPMNGEGNSNISVILEKNLFAYSRTAQVLFRNDLLDKTAILNIEQEANPTGVVGFSHLGKGYNGASGLIAYDSEVKAPVLDCQVMYEKGEIAEPNNTSETNEELITGRTIQEYASSFGTAVGASAEAFGISAGFEMNFSEESMRSEDNSFGTFRSMTKKQKLYIHKNLAPADLMESRSATFLEDLEKLNAEKLIQKYGTHVITGLSLGGVMEYSMTADLTTTQTAINFGSAVQAGFAISGFGGSTDIETDSYDACKNQCEGFEARLLCRGGQSQFTSKPNPDPGTPETYGQWLASLSDKHLWVMVDYEENGLVPLWEFIPEGELRSQVKTLAESYLKQDAFTPDPNKKTLNVKVTGAIYRGDDHGDGGEFTFDISTVLDNKLTKTLWLLDNTHGKEQDFFSEKDWVNLNVSLQTPYRVNYKKKHTLAIKFENVVEHDNAPDKDEIFEDKTFTFTYDPASEQWFDSEQNVVQSATKKGEVELSLKDIHNTEETIVFRILIDWPKEVR